MSTDWKTLRTAWCGDLHWGHRRVPTSNTLLGMSEAFNKKTLADLDILFIEGDAFDRQLYLDNQEIGIVRLWIIDLYNLSLELGFSVRVLKGTPSHDWDQSILFAQINDEIFDNKVDVRYVDKLDILHEEKWGINVLYVPDEWRPTPEQTQSEVEALMKKKGLEHVDIACMHGYFEPQMPKQLAYNAHDMDFYKSIVRYVIGIGHIHRYWRSEHIVASGSINRIAHGEEEPKGHTRIVLHRDKPRQPDVRFVENKHAWVWKTVDCRGLEVEKAKERIIAMAESLSPKSEIRILAHSTDAISVSLRYFKERYPDLVWSSKNKDEANEDEIDGQLVELATVRRSVNVFSITSENVVSLMSERDNIANSEFKDHALSRLTEIVAEFRK